MEKIMKQIRFIVEKTGTGYAAYAKDFDNIPVGTTGQTMTELKGNILSAMNLLRSHIGSNPVTMEEISIKLDLQQFFEYYKVINARALSERLGMNPTLLSQYAGGKKKPSGKQVTRILQGVRELGRELNELELV